MEDFKKKCKVFGIDLSEVQIEKFMDYYKLLIEWNSFMNLTAFSKDAIFLTAPFPIFIKNEHAASIRIWMKLKSL